MRDYDVARDGSSSFTLEELQADWTEPGFNLETDACVVESGGLVVGYGEVRHLEGQRLDSDGYVHPDHEGAGVGTALLSWMENRARQAAELSSHSQVDLGTGIHAENAAAVALLESRGFKALRFFLRERIELTGDLPGPEWPEGVRVRTLQEGEDTEPVYRKMVEYFQDHWGERRQDYQQWFHSWTEGGRFDPSLWFVAEAEGETVGISLCGPLGDISELTTLGVGRSWRKRGLGMALLRHSFSELGRRGFPACELSVDADSLTGATRLYHRAGMRDVVRYGLYAKPLK
jgi:mycothiol synthase